MNTKTILLTATAHLKTRIKSRVQTALTSIPPHAPNAVFASKLQTGIGKKSALFRCLDGNLGKKNAY